MDNRILNYYRKETRPYVIIPLFTIAAVNLVKAIERRYVKDYYIQDMLFTVQGMILIAGFCTFFYFKLRNDHPR